MSLSYWHRFSKFLFPYSADYKPFLVIIKYLTQILTLAVSFTRNRAQISLILMHC